METRKIRDTEYAIWIHGTGTPVLFVHGFPFDHTMYVPACERLSTRFQCLIPDLRGFGGSAPGGLNGHGSVEKPVFEMSEFADDLNELLNSLNIQDKIVLCGLSMGGYISMEFVRRYRSRLAGLILCDTRTTVDPPAAAENRHRLADSVAKTGLVPVAESMTPNLLAANTLENRPEITAFLKQMICRQKPEGVAAAARGMACRKDTTELLGQISVPTLVLCGEEDKPSPPDIMKEMAKQIPTAKFVTFNQSGHLPPLEQTAAFAQTVADFVGTL